MPTSITQSIPYRDKYREACFKDAYGIDSYIEVTNFLDINGNFDKVICKFRIKGVTFGLIEFYKPGDDNSTDYVVIEINGQEVSRFNKYIDAELELVKIMRDRWQP